MEIIKQEENYVERSSKQERYDKRLILKIVKEVEEGLPRKEANRKYGLGASALSTWMKKYGSEHYHQNLKRKSYSKLQKRTIVSAIEQGRMSVKEAQVAYNIKTEKTIRSWLSKFKEEKVDICIETQPQMAKQKPSNTEALEKALQEAELKIKALNTLIDVAEDQLKIDIRKKSGAKQS
ncbi:helix-turn-helix domain-containing protein [Xanthomarina sp. F1114]|uniref:helix-turn-helix domain-containing protein n=1 Tax=Xanthomarina sp. F1114 TaxID=2996019 RepID=UPI00225E38BF|nr:helix-turn-helix domain-containing protein [Xanthomarina sp. F1114]MCX7547811.1 helix-turn-helix domain-containing protein [Xanthomarina sp. F1114]